MSDTEEAPPVAAAAAFPQPVLHMQPPAPVKLDKNAVNNWKLWKQIWKHYSVVSNIDKQTPDYQRSFLLASIGTDALQIYNGSDPQDTDTVDQILTKLDTHILGEVNETFERYKFNTRIQKPDESVDTYVSALKRWSRPVTSVIVFEILYSETESFSE